MYLNVYCKDSGGRGFGRVTYLKNFSITLDNVNMSLSYKSCSMYFVFVLDLISTRTNPVSVSKSFFIFWFVGHGSRGGLATKFHRPGRDRRTRTITSKLSERESWWYTVRDQSPDPELRNKLLILF